MKTDRIRVAVVAPGLAIRIGLSTLLATEDDVEVLTDASGVQELSGLLSKVDVIIFQGVGVDQEWGTLFSKEGPSLAALWVSDDVQAARFLCGLPVRAWGIVPTEASTEELIAALRAVHQGLIVAPNEAIEALRSSAPKTKTGELVEALTAREIEVLQLLPQGLTNRQIALDLEISEHTVKFHISSIYGKLGAANRAEAVRLGLRLGLIIL
jgi:NarL family two-component system response regulator YdfI